MATNTCIDEMELAEILSLLPDFTEKTVMQFGGYCRQLTAVIAQKTKIVIIYDCGEEIVEEKEHLKDFANIEYIVVKDFQEISCPYSSVDLMFANWVFSERGDFFKKQLSWLKPDGYLFLRDCHVTSQDGGVHEATQSSETSRTCETYETRFSSLLVLGNDNNVYGFAVVSLKTRHALQKVASDGNSVFILLQKTAKNVSITNTGDFDSKDDYSISSVLFYEKAFGDNFLSIGGEDLIKETASLMDLKPGQKILDVGGGIGGAAFYLVKNFGVSAISVDISPSVTLVAQERAIEAGIGPDQVVFETADATQMDYPTESFDVVLSLATLFYIEDKLSIFKRLHNFLKPGGKLMISDYCRNDGEISDHFKSAIREHKYKLISAQEYHKMLSEDAEFMNVKVVDRTQHFLHNLRAKETKLKESEKELIQEFGDTNYNWLRDRWKKVIGHLDVGDLEWRYFYAEKSK